VAIQVFVADEQSDQPVDLPRWRGLAEQVLTDRGVPSDSELNVLYVDEETIASLNVRFLGHEGPTDVLSFPIEDEIAVPRPPPSGPNVLVSGPGRDGEDEDSMPTMLGDVLICPAVAARNAPEHAGTYDAELALLLVHGILHLLGLDHEDDGEAEEMEALERDLLARLAPDVAGSDGAE
jgi:probable rRNA maturation factor